MSEKGYYLAKSSMPNQALALEALTSALAILPWRLGHEVELSSLKHYSASGAAKLFAAQPAKKAAEIRSRRTRKIPILPPDSTRRAAEATIKAGLAASDAEYISKGWPPSAKATDNAGELQVQPAAPAAPLQW